MRDREDYTYAIAQLNVSRAKLAIAIDNWNTQILQSGPDEISVKLLEEAKEKYKSVELAVFRLNKSDYDIIEENDICPFCKIPLSECGSDHK